MSHIVIEARRGPRCVGPLDALAEGCERLGHEVYRWRGPVSGRTTCSRSLPRCDVAIVWNGMIAKYGRPLAKLRRRGAKILFAELGWYPQRDTFQIDPQGVNAGVSWCLEPIDCRERTPLRVPDAEDLLVILQFERDTQLSHYSPWYPSMVEFVRDLCAYSRLPVRIRAHPHHPASRKLTQLIEKLGGRWDRSSSLSEALANARAVACINSSSALESLARGVPVLCFGEAIYRHPGVVYCLGRDPQQIRIVTEALRRGQCDLYQERIDALLQRVRERQWAVAQIPRKLPSLLNQILEEDCDAPETGGESPTILSFSAWLDRARGKAA
ncbi:MAG: hypothetical protein JW888_10075 [Pirellulales bacterium]|nr:hypothetical protein [Pirellulales bacterium]